MGFAHDSLKFNWNAGIQICSSHVGRLKESNFNNIIREIIKKSLFTERQVEIILNQKDLSGIKVFYNKRCVLQARLGSPERN